MSSQNTCFLCYSIIGDSDEGVSKHMKTIHHIGTTWACACCNWHFRTSREVNEHMSSVLSTGTGGLTKPLSISMHQPGSLLMPAAERAEASGVVKRAKVRGGSVSTGSSRASSTSPSGATAVEFPMFYTEKDALEFMRSCRAYNVEDFYDPEETMKIMATARKLVVSKELVEDIKKEPVEQKPSATSPETPVFKTVAEAAAFICRRDNHTIQQVNDPIIAKSIMDKAAKLVGGTVTAVLEEGKKAIPKLQRGSRQSSPAAPSPSSKPAGKARRESARPKVTVGTVPPVVPAKGVPKFATMDEAFKYLLSCEKYTMVDMGNPAFVQNLRFMASQLLVKEEEVTAKSEDENAAPTAVEATRKPEKVEQKTPVISKPPAPKTAAPVKPSVDSTAKGQSLKRKFLQEPADTQMNGVPPAQKTLPNLKTLEEAIAHIYKYVHFDDEQKKHPEHAKVVSEAAGTLLAAVKKQKEATKKDNAKKKNERIEDKKKPSPLATITPDASMIPTMALSKAPLSLLGQSYPFADLFAGIPTTLSNLFGASSDFPTPAVHANAAVKPGKMSYKDAINHIFAVFNFTPEQLAVPQTWLYISTIALNLTGGVPPTPEEMGEAPTTAD